MNHSGSSVFERPILAGSPTNVRHFRKSGSNAIEQLLRSLARQLDNDHGDNSPTLKSLPNIWSSGFLRRACTPPTEPTVRWPFRQFFFSLTKPLRRPGATRKPHTSVFESSKKHSAPRNEAKWFLFRRIVMTFWPDLVDNGTIIDVLCLRFFQRFRSCVGGARIASNWVTVLLATVDWFVCSVKTLFKRWQNSLYCHCK